MSRYGEKAGRVLPAGWRVISNEAFLSPLEKSARDFADAMESEYGKLFGLYTRSESQVVVLEGVPAEDAVTRACTLLFERGFRVQVRWVDRGAGKVSCGSFQLTKRAA